MIPFLIGLAVFALTTYAHYDSRGRVGRYDVGSYALLGCAVWTLVAAFSEILSALWSLL